MGALKIIVTLIAGVVFAALIMTAGNSFEEDKLTKWMKAVIGACVFIATNLVTSVAPAVVGLLAVVLPLGGLAYLFIWWAEDGSTVKELVIFILMGIMLYFSAMSAVARVVDLSESWIVRGIVMSIPRIAYIVFVAFIVSNMIAFREKMRLSLEGGEDDEE